MFFGRPLSRFERRPAARLIVGAARGTFGMRRRQQALSRSRRPTLDRGRRLGGSRCAWRAFRARRLRLARGLVDGAIASDCSRLGLPADRLGAGCGARPAIVFFEDDLLVAQPPDGLAAIALRVFDAGSRDEARQTLPLSLIEACLGRSALVRDPIPLLAEIRSRWNLCRDQSPADEQRDQLDHTNQS
jgi:hypothetical protein